MSRHQHKSPDTSKNVKLELELMHESKVAAEEAKAELLEHNNILKLHADDSPAATHDQNGHVSESEMQREQNVVKQASFEQKADPIVVVPYIKQAEDMERIAKNTMKSFSAQPKAQTTDMADIFQSNINQLLDLQLQAMSALMQNWSSLFDIMTKPVARLTE